MARMRMMGAESVSYHRATVLERGDDHPGQALAYYASRGETPLVWGGSGAQSLGLPGAVSGDAYEAVYGPGGIRHPGTGERLVTVRRPGMELVVSSHKSVAELGVIGRAEDMHAIMDAERDATLAYLDAVTKTVSRGPPGMAGAVVPARTVAPRQRLPTRDRASTSQLGHLDGDADLRNRAGSLLPDATDEVAKTCQLTFRFRRRAIIEPAERVGGSERCRTTGFSLVRVPPGGLVDRYLLM